MGRGRWEGLRGKGGEEEGLNDAARVLEHGMCSTRCIRYINVNVTDILTQCNGYIDTDSDVDSQSHPSLGRCESKRYLSVVELFGKTLQHMVMVILTVTVMVMVVVTVMCVLLPYTTFQYCTGSLRLSR